MKVAYFINQYPKVSHSFIRREILELENQGVEVVRFSIRRDGSDLVDQQDLDELSRTCYLTEMGMWKILKCVLMVLLTSPVKFYRALSLTIAMGRRSYVGVIKHLFYLIEACVLGAWAREFGVRHIHAHFGSNSTSVVLLTKFLYETTYSFTVHGPAEFDKPEALSLGDKIKHAMFVIAISSYGRSQLYRWCNHKYWGKIQIIHCALGDDFLDSVPVKAPKETRIICVGRLCEAKGQLLLLEAVAHLIAEGVDISLILAGDGPMRCELEEMISLYRIGDHVKILGWISSMQVRREIIASKALVMASFAEGLPVAIMEACALRRPIITTAIAGIPELVVHNELGWVVTAGDLKGLINALRSLDSESQPVLIDMGEKAYQAVCKKHNIHIEVEKLRVLFNDVVASLR